MRDIRKYDKLLIILSMFIIVTIVTVSDNINTRHIVVGIYLILLILYSFQNIMKNKSTNKVNILSLIILCITLIMFLFYIFYRH